MGPINLILFRFYQPLSRIYEESQVDGTFGAKMELAQEMKKAWRWKSPSALGVDFLIKRESNIYPKHPFNYSFYHIK